MANWNVQDPAVQEKIRRGSHAYVPGEGKHGVYVERPYIHTEYPKIMDRTPRPKISDFKGKPEAQQLFEQACSDWDGQIQSSIVNSKEEEKAWIKKNEKAASAA